LIVLYDPHVTNVCFGGRGFDTVYLTSSGRGVVYEMDRPKKSSRSA
jgi:sugar lactone lactonase YvrE